VPSVVIQVYEYERGDLARIVENHEGSLEQQGATGGSKESMLGPELMLSFKVSTVTDEALQSIQTALQMNRDVNTAG